jgi:hypothetical protein
LWRLGPLFGTELDWITSIKDLGQIFLLTPVFPLIGTVIGYMFGRQQEGGQVQDASGGG